MTVNSVLVTSCASSFFWGVLPHIYYKYKTTNGRFCFPTSLYLKPGSWLDLRKKSKSNQKKKMLRKWWRSGSFATCPPDNIFLHNFMNPQAMLVGWLDCWLVTNRKLELRLPTYIIRKHYFLLCMLETKVHPLNSISHFMFVRLFLVFALLLKLEKMWCCCH